MAKDLTRRSSQKEAFARQWKRNCLMCWWTNDLPIHPVPLRIHQFGDVWIHWHCNQWGNWSHMVSSNFSKCFLLGLGLRQAPAKWQRFVKWAANLGTSVLGLNHIGHDRQWSLDNSNWRDHQRVWVMKSLSYEVCSPFALAMWPRSDSISLECI